MEAIFPHFNTFGFTTAYNSLIMPPFHIRYTYVGRSKGDYKNDGAALDERGPYIINV